MPKISPRRERERRGTQPIGCELFELQQRLSDGARAARIQVLERASDHQADDVVAARIRCHAAACVPAIAQHHEAVGHLRHLLDEMRDVHDGKALPLEPVDNLKQFAHIAVRETARRLVEDEHAAAERERARDLDKLLRRR